MKLFALALTLVFAQQIPKYNPNGVWTADSGSQFDIRGTGSDLHVKIVPDSNPKFLQYELDLKNLEEINTYKGTGFFIAKMNSGKECKFSTDWQFVVVSPDRIIGSMSIITANPDTCEIQEKGQAQLDLKKK